MIDANEQSGGSASQSGGIALLLIDVINDLDFPEADMLLPFAIPMARNIAALKRRARAKGIPVIYVNDNFGRWRSDLKAQVEHCLQATSRGRPMVELLLPDEEDYFVLKPKHSGFFATTLETLLKYHGVETLILTGLATDICVLFTANDAYMRDYKLVVPRDCAAANTEALHVQALAQIEKTLKADITASAQLSLPGSVTP